MASDATSQTRVAVCVASRDRPMRLLWLLNALEEQTLPRDRFEVVVAHDSAGPEPEEVLTRHPLRLDGTLRHLTFPHGSMTVGGNRNAAWRESRAPLIAFTDDDCRPEPDWLERLLGAWEADHRAVLQGAVGPDPYEAHVLTRVPWARTIRVEPPDWRGQACNIAYPRALLDRVGGFDDAAAWGGEDTDLYLRVWEHARAPIVAVGEARVHHAVHPVTLWGHLRSTQRWMHLPFVLGRHPWLRRHEYLGLFWKERHARLLLAITGPLIARPRALGLLAAVPWLRSAYPRLGTSPRLVVRAILALPARAAVDLAEIVAMIRGSIRYRTPFL